jgi:hypothetical protein
VLRFAARLLGVDLEVAVRIGPLVLADLAVQRDRAGVVEHRERMVRERRHRQRGSNAEQREAAHSSPKVHRLLPDPILPALYMGLRPFVNRLSSVAPVAATMRRASRFARNRSCGLPAIKIPHAALAQAGLPRQVLTQNGLFPPVTLAPP